MLVEAHVLVFLGCAIYNAVIAAKDGPFALNVKVSVNPLIQESKSAVIMQENTSRFQALQQTSLVPTKATRDLEE